MGVHKNTINREYKVISRVKRVINSRIIEEIFVAKSMQHARAMAVTKYGGKRSILKIEKNY